MSTDAQLQAPSIDLPALVDSLVSQPELFPKSGAPFSATDASLLRAADSLKTSQPDAERYSARNTSKDERRCLSIAALVMMGWSHRKIAEEMTCDRRLIASVVERLERSGVLPPLSTRVTRAEAELREQTLRWLDELIGSGAVTRDAAAMIRGLFTGAGILATHQNPANGSGGGTISVQVGVAISPGGTWQSRVEAEIRSASDSHSPAAHCAAVSYADSTAPDAVIDAGSASHLVLDAETSAVLVKGGVGGASSAPSIGGSIPSPQQQSPAEAPSPAVS